MIAAALSVLLAAAPKLELGGYVGQGHIFGEGKAAEGRASNAVDAIRDPWTAGCWLGWQLSRGNQLGLRLQSWRAEQDAVAMDDLGGGSETLEIDIVGPEYTRIVPWGKVNQLRVGGGFGLAEALDHYESDWGEVKASGSGMAAWLRGGVVSPLGKIAALHVEFEGSWSTFSRMSSKGAVDTYSTSYLILQSTLGLSFGL